MKKGQLIAKIDPQLFQAALEQAKRELRSRRRATVTKAQAQADDAERQYERAQALFERKADRAGRSRHRASQRATPRDGDWWPPRRRWTQAKAALHQAQVNLDYTDIISPIDGMVISRSVDVGQTVAASLPGAHPVH